MANQRRFHFSGICGTAMGAVAAAMKQKGFHVTGSDTNVYPPMSDFLQQQGIEIFSGYAEQHIPEDTDVIVIGNAISRGNPEAEAALNRKLLYYSLPEVMKEYFLRGKRNFVVTGTHGKTTTTSMLTWLFTHAEKNPGYMIGGLPKNLSCGAKFTDSDINVLEGDEYDTSFFDKRSKFLHYLPECVIINNIEFDHADIYNSLDEIKLTFRRLLNIVPNQGVAFINGDDPHACEVALQAPCPVLKVGFGDACDVVISKVKYLEHESIFDLNGITYHLPMTGEFNVRNASMSIMAGSFGGLNTEQIQAGLASFEGVARRQELRGEVKGIKIIDDFAHHPTAIQQVIKSLKQRYPQSRLWVLFEPRSNTTRRAVFQHELAHCFAEADFAVISAIPDLHKIPEHDRLDPNQLAHDIQEQGTEAWYLDGVDTIVQQVKSLALSGDVIAVLSNGSFGGIHQLLLKEL